MDEAQRASPGKHWPREVSSRTAGPEILRLIDLLAKLPGLGPRSARRAALHLLKKPDQLLNPLAAALADAAEKVVACSVCANFDTVDPCSVCSATPPGITSMVAGSSAICPAVNTRSLQAVAWL